MLPDGDDGAAVVPHAELAQGLQVGAVGRDDLAQVARRRGDDVVGVVDREHLGALPAQFEGEGDAEAPQPDDDHRLVRVTQ